MSRRSSKVIGKSAQIGKIKYGNFFLQNYVHPVAKLEFKPCRNFQEVRDTQCIK